MLAHGQLYPGVGNLRDPVYGDFKQWQIDNLHPDSWKGYNIATAEKVDFDPNSPMIQWVLDDEVQVYPMYEIIARNRHKLRKHPGFFNICVHKGLFTNAPADPGSATRAAWIRTRQHRQFASAMQRHSGLHRVIEIVSTRFLGLMFVFSAVRFVLRI